MKPLPAFIRLSGLCLATLPLSAQSDSLPFGFAPAEIFTGDHNMVELRTGDFNQDGLLDVVVINQDKSRLDFYFQNSRDAEKAPTPNMHRDRWQPVLSHPRFTVESLIPGAQLYSLEVGDFNRDGVIDFATVNSRDQLDIYHGPLGKFKKPSHTLPVNKHHGQADCLKWHEADQRLYYLGPELLESVHWDKDTKTYLGEKVARTPNGQSPFSLQFTDLNQDGKADIIYELADENYGLAVHIREGKSWLPLKRPRLEPASAYFIPGTDAGTLYGIHNDSGAIQAFQFEEVSAIDAQHPLSIQEIHLENTRQGQFLCFTNRKGQLQSLLVFTPGQTELLLMKTDKRGDLGLPERMPIPSGCQWMLQGHFLPGSAKKGPEQVQVLLHNSSNRYLGMMEFKDGSPQFPLSLPNTEAIICAAAWQLDGADEDQLVAIVRLEKRKLAFKRWQIRESDEGLVLEEMQHVDLTDLKRDPEEILPLPPSPKRPNGFLVTSPLGDSFYLFASEEDPESLTVVNPPKGFSSEQLKKKRAKNFRTFPGLEQLPGSFAYFDGGEIQFYEVNAQGTLRLLNQINSKDISSVQDLLPLDEKGHEIALVSSAGREVEIHRFEKDQGYVFKEKLTFPGGSFHSSALQSLSDGRHELQLLGNHQFRRIFPQPETLQLSSTTLFQSGLPDYWPDLLYLGDMNGDEQQDLILLEQYQFHMFEILGKRENEWHSAMHFPVFETAPGSQRSNNNDAEPREVRVVDMNADGLDDLIMLVHDRMLLYLQDPVKP